MTLSEELMQRGLVKQTTDPALLKKIDQQSMTLYIGFDSTADSLHIGSLLPLLVLRKFQKAGHTVIALLGSATTMIGDPSGKSQERKQLSLETIESNTKGIRIQIEKFLDFDSKNNSLIKPARLLNNLGWFHKMTFLDFLRDIGKHFSVNMMLQKDSVKARLEDRAQGISFTEFSYMLLQAYDFWVLHDRHGCDLQVGGSDQWGNITAGIDYIRRMRAEQGARTTNAPSPHADVYGLTLPLLEKSDGTKFGKSESGNIWLDPTKTTPYQFYQFLIQTADSDVIPLLYKLSDHTIDEIKTIEKEHKISPEKRLAQRALAKNLTTLVHGEKETLQIEGASQALFSDDLSNLSEQELLKAFETAPKLVITEATLLKSPKLVDWLVETKLCSSKSAARKEIESGGIYLNQMRVSDVGIELSLKNCLHQKHFVLRRGKKTYCLISINR